MHLWLLARLHVLWALPIPDQSLALVFLHSTLTGFLALLTWFSCCNSSGEKKKTKPISNYFVLAAHACYCSLSHEFWDADAVFKNAEGSTCLFTRALSRAGLEQLFFPHKTTRVSLRPSLKCTLLQRVRSRNHSAKVRAAGHLILASWCFITRLPFKPGHAGWAAALLESHWRGPALLDIWLHAAAHEPGL